MFTYRSCCCTFHCTVLYLPFSDLITGSLLTVEKSNLIKNSKIKLAPTNYFHQKVPTVSDVSMTYKTLMSPKENPNENNSTFINLDDELDAENLHRPRRYQRVQALSELFFAQQLKIAERKRILLSNCQNEESRIFSSIIKTLKETKVPISNTALFMLETKYELYRILEDSDCDELRNRIILN